MSKIDLDHFEKIFMYKCITDEEYFTTIVDVTNVDYLKYSENKLIFNIIKDFFSKRSALPTLTELKTYITTKDEISAFKFILNIVQTLDKTFNKDELIENTERFLKERAVYNTILEVADSIHTGDFDTSLILDKFEKNCNISLISDSGIEVYSNIDNVIADLNNTEPVIASKWKWLDDKLDGGFLQNGRGLYIFAGQTNIGKSIVLGNIAKNIAETGKTVLLITLEMSEMMYAKRICSSVSKIPIRELRTNCRLLKETITDIKNKNPKGRIFIKEFPPSLITPNQLSAFIKKLKSKGINIDAIVLDYLNLLNSPVGSNSYERVKYLSEQVRALTYVFSCPIVTATQINRCLDINTNITLDSGKQVKLKDIKVGDIIRGNTPVIVKHIYPPETQKCYRITLRSGKTVICSKQHIFPTTDGCKNINSGLTVGDKLYSICNAARVADNNTKSTK